MKLNSKRNGTHAFRLFENQQDYTLHKDITSQNRAKVVRVC